MPKLSENTLKKRFSCPICGEHFRTRQGLSGHIQWKHYSVKKFNYTELDSIITWGKQYEWVSKKAGIPESETDQQIRIVTSWPRVANILESLKLDANDKDFKQYLLSALAYMREINQLEERLSKRISDIFEEYKLRK